MVYVFLANGFEETEALTTVDFLRRCKIDVTTAGVGTLDVKGSHGIVVIADTVDSLVKLDDDLQAIVLPGGIPGTPNEEKSEFVQSAIDFCAQNGRKIAAICAAPSILGHKSLLDGKKVTCYPGFEDQLGNADYVGLPAVTDGDIITGKGAGCTIEFAYHIAAALGFEDKAKEVIKSIQCSR